MKKNEFKVGDVVNLYQGGFKFSNMKIYHILDDKVFVSPSCLGYHFKQCRRLKKKERRRIWVNPTKVLYGEVEVGVYVNRPAPDWIEFVEVKKK